MNEYTNKHNPIMTYWNHDMYSICDEDGEKTIHINGYYYDEESAYFVEFCGMGFSLSDFISWKLSSDDINEIAAEYNQNYYDVQHTEAGEIMKDSLKSGEFSFLAYEDITMDTPCGNYVDARITPEFVKEQQNENMWYDT